MIREKAELKPLVQLLDANKENMAEFNIVLDDSELNNDNFDVVVQVTTKGKEITLMTIFENIGIEEANVKAVIMDSWFEEDIEFKAFYNNQVEENYSK